MCGIFKNISRIFLEIRFELRIFFVVCIIECHICKFSCLDKRVVQGCSQFGRWFKD